MQQRSAWGQGKTLTARKRGYSHTRTQHRSQSPISGVKIDYHKSGVVTFGVSKEIELAIANMLNCKVGQLLMKYLRFPISDKRVGVEAFKGVVDQMRHGLQPWKGKNITSGGRLILTNTSLSSMHAYQSDEHVPLV